LSEEEDKKEFLEFAKKHASEKGIRLNPDERIVNGIVAGLFKREKSNGEKYCPCRVVSGNKEEDKKIICPCVYHLDEIAKDGKCHCQLFVAKE